MLFQQDSATCLSAFETLNLLLEKFPDRIISRDSVVNRRPRSCDLTPWNYFLQGYVKNRVYVDNAKSIEDLKTNIRRVIGEIESKLCKNVNENFDKRIDICKRGRGGHLSEIIFHLQIVDFLQKDFKFFKLEYFLSKGWDTLCWNFFSVH